MLLRCTIAAAGCTILMAAALQALVPVFGRGDLALTLTRVAANED